MCVRTRVCVCVCACVSKFVQFCFPGVCMCVHASVYVTHSPSLCLKPRPTQTATPPRVPMETGRLSSAILESGVAVLICFTTSRSANLQPDEIRTCSLCVRGNRNGEAKIVPDHCGLVDCRVFSRRGCRLNIAHNHRTDVYHVHIPSCGTAPSHIHILHVVQKIQGAGYTGRGVTQSRGLQGPSVRAVFCPGAALFYCFSLISFAHRMSILA